MFKYLRKIALVVTLVAIMFFSADHSYAANTFFGGRDFPDLVKQVYLFGSAIVGVVAVVALVIAGIFYMTAGGNQDRVKKAREMLGGALAGLFLIMGSYLILNTLNPELVNFRIETQNLQLKEGGKCLQDNDCFAFYINVTECDAFGDPKTLINLQTKCEGANVSSKTKGDCVVPKGTICGLPGAPDVARCDAFDAQTKPCESGSSCSTSGNHCYGKWTDPACSYFHDERFVRLARTVKVCQ